MKKRKKFIIDGSNKIVSMLYIKETLLHPAHTIFLLGNKFPKILIILSREQLNLNFSKESLEKKK